MQSSIPAGVAALIAFLFGGPLLAEPAPLPPAVVGLELISGWQTADGAHVAAIEMRLAPGWHTYWRVPGLSGIPPTFDWSASRNLASVAYEWPRPALFDSFGVPTIGFKDALVLPVILTPETIGEPIEATVTLQFGVCRDICIPAEARLTARLGATAPPEGRAAIERALAARPLDAGAAGVTRARCDLAPAGPGREIIVEITFDAPPGRDLTTVIEAEGRPDLWIGQTETRTEGRAVHATARLDALDPGGLALDRGALRLTLLDTTRAIDIRGCPAD